MKRLIESAFYSFLFTLYGSCLYYAVGVFYTLSQNGDVVKFFLDTLIGAAICFFALTFVFWEISGAFHEMNKRGRDQERKDEKKDGSPPSS